MHLMAGSAERRAAMNLGLEKYLLVKVRLGLDELTIDPLQHRMIAVRKGIVHRFVDGVVGVAANRVDVGDAVTD